MLPTKSGCEQQIGFAYRLYTRNEMSKKIEHYMFKKKKKETYVSTLVSFSMK